MSWRRVVSIALGGLLVAVVGLRLALPSLARDALVDAIGEATGRGASLESVSFGLLGGRAALRGLVLSGDDAPALELAALSLQLSWRELLGGRVHLRSLSLSGLDFRIGAGEAFIRDGAEVAEPASQPDDEGAVAAAGSDLAPEAPSEPVPASDGAESEASGWPILIEAIELRDLQLVFGDAPELTQLELAGLDLASLRIDAEGVALGALSLDRPQLHTVLAEADPATSEPSGGTEPFRVGPLVDDLPGTRLAGLRLQDGAVRLQLAGGELELGLDFEVGELVLQRGGETRLSLRVQVAGGDVVLEGRLQLDPLRFAGTLQWSELELSRLQPLLVGVELGPGTSSAELEVDLAVLEHADGEAMSAGLRGELALLGMRIEASEMSSVGWDSLLVTFRELRFDQPASGAAPALRVELAALRLAGPEVAWSLAPAAAEVEPAPGAAEPAETSLALEVAVDLVQVVGGRIQLRDPGVTPPLEVRGRFEASAEALHFPRRDLRRLSVSLTGDEGESVALSGQLEAGLGELSADIESIGLTRFDPYAARQGGVRIEDGRLSWRGKVALAEASTRVDGTLVLAALDLDAPKGVLDGLIGVDVVGVPFDAAIVMLRDAEGRISLPTEVRVDADRTRISLANIIAKALRQAVFNVLTTPLATVRLLRDLTFDGGDVALPHIAFAPGSAVPNEAARERLVPLVELLQQRDDVSLVLIGRASDAEAALSTAAEAADETPQVRLGRERAEAAARILTEELGVPADRVSVQPPEEGAPGLHLVLRKR